MSCLLVLSGMVFTACSNDDLSTDQYGNDISLNSFGPCPVLRGGTLRFLGSNLDQITKVKIPGVDTITAITVVTAGQHSEITVQVPKENCTEGTVSLYTAKGGVINTVTPISYEENIKLTKFYVGTSGTEQGSVGDVVTIEGDYLNLIHAVIFQDGVKVPETAFTKHTRYMITVAIPKAAQTGKIALSDENAAGANYLYSDDALTVDLPSCTALTPAKPKAGETMTFTGTSLNLIKTVTFEGAEVDSAAITSSADGKTLTCILPAKATDGEVNLVTYSGIKIPAGSITTVVPTELKAVPVPVKNGATITVTGKDLDLVTALAFNKADGKIATQSATQITAVVPDAAQDGDLTLTLANGKTVTVAYELVKPTVTSFVPATIMAGNAVVLQGTDLDLISSVTFPGEGSPTVESDKFTAQTSSAIALTIPASAVGTGCTLTLKNGTTMSVASGLTITAATDPTIATAPVTANPGKEISVTGKNLNNVEAFYIGTYKITKISSRSDVAATFTVPANCAFGDFNIIMEGFDGAKYTGPTITVQAAEIDLSAICVKQSDQSASIAFPLALTWDDNGRFRVQRGGKPNLETLGLVAGKSKLIIYKNTSKGQAQINDGNWSSFTTMADWAGDVEKLEYTFTQDMVDWCTGTKSDGWSKTAFIIQGDGYTINKICILP